MKALGQIMICLSLLATCFISCLDVVQLDLPTENEIGPYIVEGLITQGKGPHRVQVSRVTPIGIRRNTPASLDEIWIENNHDQKEFLVSLGDGIFELEGTEIEGIIGDEYRLHFRTIDEQEYVSDWEKLLPVSKIDSLYFERSFEDRFTDEGYLVGKNFLDIYADIKLTTLPESPFMRWETERWWLLNEFIRPSPPSKACYVKDPLLNNNRIQLFDGRGVNAGIWKRQLIGSVEADFRFFEKTYINLHQFSLTPEAFAYWQKLDKVVNQSGDIFDTPPAAIPGNVHNVSNASELVLGYFGASAVDTFHLPIFRQDLGVRVDWICSLPGINDRYSIHPCFQCLVVPNSIAERPDYW
ncbi:MAG: DUF4249 domain-containing protein [Bacteroidia bacterium]